jgi:hypothetical protein
MISRLVSDRRFLTSTSLWHVACYTWQGTNIKQLLSEYSCTISQLTGWQTKQIEKNASWETEGLLGFKKLSPFYSTLGFITVFKRARNTSISSVRHSSTLAPIARLDARSSKLYFQHKATANVRFNIRVRFWISEWGAKNKQISGRSYELRKIFGAFLRS